MVVFVDKGGTGSINPQFRTGEFEVSMPAGFKYTSMDVGYEYTPEPEKREENAPNPVKILDYSPDKIILSVDAQSDGYVVLCDSYYPRWQAYVNGEKEEILRANSTVRAIPVHKGENHIHFICDAGAFRNAALTSLAAFILCVVACALDVFLGVRRAKQRP